METTQRTYTAFAGYLMIARGEIKEVLRETKNSMDGGETGAILIFDDYTGAQIDFDLRGTKDEVVARLSSHPHFALKTPDKAGPGRPRLGVVSREVSLLPRHWEWLEEQPKGISATIRRLVEEAIKAGSKSPNPREQAINAAGKFMWAMAGNLPGFEEASRAL